MHNTPHTGTVAVVGGAGYIGSHTAMKLAETGRRVVVIDNLSTGHSTAARFGEFIEADIAETEVIRDIFVKFHVDAAFHFAALTCAGESVAAPDKYYRNNVRNSLSLLDAMRQTGVGKIIFSSTCSLYGKMGDKPLLTEEHAIDPTNPYARTKLILEWAILNYADAYGMRYTSLRYFNAAGAEPRATLGEVHEPETHLIPLILKAALEPGRVIRIFGTDYPTPDGTCRRDYIHVCDLADAHILALDRFDAGGSSEVFNLGNGKGYSVREVIACARTVADRPIAVEEHPRRAGDPPRLVGSAAKAEKLLGWRPKFTELETILRTAWNWESQSSVKLNPAAGR